MGKPIIVILKLRAITTWIIETQSLVGKLRELAEYTSWWYGTEIEGQISMELL